MHIISNRLFRSNSQTRGNKASRGREKIGEEKKFEKQNQTFRSNHQRQRQATRTKIAKTIFRNIRITSASARARPLYRGREIRNFFLLRNAAAVLAVLRPTAGSGNARSTTVSYNTTLPPYSCYRLAGLEPSGAEQQQQQPVARAGV